MTSPGHYERRRDDRHASDEPAEPAAAAPRADRSGMSSEERLEALLAERRRELEEHARRLEDTMSDVERREEHVRDARTSVERVLRVGAADLEAREADLAELAHELQVREARMREEEAALAQRRSELGAVELKRAAVELREQAVATRESEVSAREAELEARESATSGEALEDEGPSALLLFVPGGAYRFAEIEHGALGRGETLALDGAEYLVARVGSSPLPGDGRRCAYLVLGPRRGTPSDGSS
jgi:hypothetical protein